MSATAAPAGSAHNENSPKSGSVLPCAGSVFWLYALIGLLAAMHLSMVTGRSINWDEFWFYSQVEIVARGEFIQPLQTIHTRFFAPWLPGMPGNEVDHILVARFFMLACLAVTAWGIYLIAEKLSDTRIALLVVAAYLGAGFVLQHGASFRVDPIVTALLTTGLAIVARTRLTLPAILALGIVIGLAAMVTIKMVLWLPAFAGVALWRWQDEKWDWRYLGRWVAAGAVSLFVFGLLYLWHSTGGGDEANALAGGLLERSSGKMFGFLDSPHLPIASKAIVTALPLVIAIALVPSAVLRLEATWQRKIAFLAMWLPVLTPVFYINSLPYFYPFILPPVVATGALTMPIFVKRYGSHLVAGFIAAAAMAVWITDTRGITDRQHELVDGVHKTFAEPVNYIDCCGMVGRFSKVNEFRTQWGVEKYLRTGRPLILEAMREEPVPLLLDNNKEFSRAIYGLDESTFHPQDVEAMRGTYIRLWGDIFVAGRELAPKETHKWRVLVPGTYTVEGTVEINGKRQNNGAQVELDRGTVELTNPGTEVSRITWGENTKAPSGEVPAYYWTTW